MFGKPAFNYNNYISNNYTTVPNTTNSNGLNGTSCSTSTIHGSFVQDYNEQNANLLNNVYNQMNTSDVNINGLLNQRTTMLPNNTNNSTEIENILMNRSLGLGFSHFGNAANYLNAASAVAAVAAAATQSSLTYSSSPSSSSSNLYGSHSSQNYPMNNEFHSMQKQNSIQHSTSTNESKMSLTPTSSSLSSASSPNYLSESIESSSHNNNHSTISNNNAKNNRNSQWQSSAYSFQNSNKNENSWPIDRKSNFFCL